MRELQGTGEGMAEANHPIDKVRALQRALYVAAKQQRQRRFHALYDRIARPDVLRRAWRQVRHNKGAAGIDGETLEAIEAYGVEKMLTELQAVLVWIPTQAEGPRCIRGHSQGSEHRSAVGGGRRLC